MIIPFRPKRKLKDRIRERLVKFSDRVRISSHKMPTRRFAAYFLRQKAGKLRRHAKYLIEDGYFGLKKISTHLEVFLFSAILAITVFMAVTAGTDNAITTLIAVILLVLTVVIYAQLKVQRRMIRQYLPTIDVVRIRKCQLYSDRVRVVNLYGVKDRLSDIGKIRNIEIAYDIVNESYSPISVEGVALTIKLRNGRRIALPSSVSIVDAEPKKTSGGTVSFRLQKELIFESIEWLEMEIRGNCRKKVRIRPHLYVNIMVRGKVPEFIKEPFAKFRRRPEIAEM
jgi:hypothetical protein